MSQLRLKQIAGPADNKAGSVIVFENNKPQWSTDLSTSLKLPKGTTLQRPVAAEEGMIRYNTTIGAVEFHTGVDWKRLDPDLSVFLNHYTFWMDYTSDQKVGAITQLPPGWTTGAINATDFEIVHNSNRLPGGGYLFGQIAVGGNNYQIRNFSSAVVMTFDITNKNKFKISGITSPSFIGTPAGGKVQFHIFM